MLDSFEKITHLILKLGAGVLIYLFYFNYTATVKPDFTYIHKFDSLTTKIKLLEQNDSVINSRISESENKVSQIDSVTSTNHKQIKNELQKLKTTPNKRVVSDADSIFRANR
jgi:hypothetical protein